MPRSNRPRRASSRGRATGRAAKELQARERGEDDLAQLTAGMRREQVRRGQRYIVQPIRAERALKPYTCPGCGGTIPAGIPHIAAWRADGILGDAHDLAERRHWHEHCWRIA